MGLILAERGATYIATAMHSCAFSRDNETRASRTPKWTEPKSWSGCAKGLCATRHPIYRGAEARIWPGSGAGGPAGAARKISRTLDRVEDLLPLSLEIARLKMWAARRKSSRRGEDHPVIWSTMCRWPSREADPFEQAARRETLARLESALAQLGERCRELFRLKLEGYTFRGDPGAAESGGAEHALYLGFPLPQAASGTTGRELGSSGAKRRRRASEIKK